MTLAAMSPLERSFRSSKISPPPESGGRQIIVVSSGAVALGADALKMKSSGASLAQKQALAAIGQSRLMNLYEQGFAKYGLTAAQVLLTEEDFSSRKRYLNLRHTLTTLLEMGVIPVINENDTVSTTELEVTDRSRASATTTNSARSS